MKLRILIIAVIAVMLTACTTEVTHERCTDSSHSTDSSYSSDDRCSTDVGATEAPETHQNGREATETVEDEELQVEILERGFEAFTDAWEGDSYEEVYEDTADMYWDYPDDTDSVCEEGEGVYQDPDDQILTDDVYSLAWELYGMDEYTTTGALKLISGEGNEFDWYLNYCTACATIVDWYRNDCGDIYEAFGGTDPDYRYWNYGDIYIEDSTIDIFREALLNTDWRCVEVNGLCNENGEYWTGRSIDSAWYAVWFDGMWYGVWEY